MTELGAIAIAALAITVLGALWHSRRAKRGRKRPSSAGAFGWALLFLNSGRMPPPPPQSQIEQETSEKKNRETGRDHTS